MVDPLFLTLFIAGLFLLLCAGVAFALYQFIGFDNRDLGEVFSAIYVGTSVGGYFVLFGAFLYMFIRKGLGFESELRGGYRPKAKGRCENCWRPLPIKASFCPRCGKKAKTDLSRDRKSEIVDELIQKKSELPSYSFYFFRGLYLYRPYYFFLLGIGLFFLALLLLDYHTADGIDPELILIIFDLVFALGLLFLGPIATKNYQLSFFKEASYEVHQNGILIHEVHARGKRFVTLETFVEYKSCFAGKETEDGYLLFTHIGDKRYAIGLPTKGIAFSTVSFIKAKVFAVTRRKE